MTGGGNAELRPDTEERAGRQDLKSRVSRKASAALFHCKQGETTARIKNIALRQDWLAFGGDFRVRREGSVAICAGKWLTESGMGVV